MKTVLGIDCGTQSTKVLVYDADKRRVAARGRAPHEWISRDDGTREQEAAWWIEALRTALASIDPALLRSVSAVGVSGQQHGFVALDSRGAVLAPVKLWCDTSTAAECGQITARAGGEKRLIEKAGNPILPGYTASKILWMKNNRPELYRRLQTILLPHDYLNYRLTGRLCMEAGDASGTGMLDIRNRRWSPEVLTAVDPDRDLAGCLPPLIGPDAACGVVSAEASDLFGLPRGVPVSCGGGDNMMAAIGAGVTRPGTAAASLGTSGTLYGYSDAAVVDAGGRLAAFCSSTGGWLPLVCTMNCTVATELTRRFLNADLDELEKLAAEAPPGSAGVVMLPFFNGERTPNLARGRGSLAGLTPDNYTPANVARASMESALFGLKLGLEIFGAVGLAVREIRLSGGGSRSALWRRMAADIFGVAIECPAEEEAAAFGGCLQAWRLLEGAGWEETARYHVRFEEGKRCEPEPARAGEYQNAYDLYQKHVRALSPLYQ